MANNWLNVKFNNVLDETSDNCVAVLLLLISFDVVVNYSITFLLFAVQGIKDSKLVYMITYNDWQSGKNLPTSIESFLVILERANLYRKSFPEAPMTILCQYVGLT